MRSEKRRWKGRLAAVALGASLAAGCGGCTGREAPGSTRLAEPIPAQIPATPPAEAPDDTRPPRTGAAPEPGPPGVFSERDLGYLERGLGQMTRLSRRIGDVGPVRTAAGALAAAALASAGRLPREDVAGWLRQVLDACEPPKRGRHCDQAEMPIQRIVLQYPEVVPPDLLERLRVLASRPVPPPGAEAIANPWSHRATENQRMVQVARSLAAHKVAGTPDSPASRAWGHYAQAYLAAHDREGWYEAESPGYLGMSITALAHLADHAPQPEVRELAIRQVNFLFADWAQEQVGGFPAGAKSRTYVHWALGARNTPWQAWAWLAAGLGEPEKVSFMDWPELATSGYEFPEAVSELLARRSEQPPYEIRSRRSIDMAKRRDLEAALYSWATPDYILGTSQAIGGMSLGVSGGQEIQATLYPEGGGFSPLYLWSRTRNPRAHRWKSFAGQDLAVGHRNLALARLGAGDAAADGHAYLSPPWSRPEIFGDVAVARRGDTYVALVTEGGWEVAPAPERYPEYYGGDKNFRGSWVAVPKRQPAHVALEVGRRAEHGQFETWKERARRARLTVSEAGEMRFQASDGTPFTFLPGERAAVGGQPIEPRTYPRLAAPFLSSEGDGRWRFEFGKYRYRFEPLAATAGGHRPARP